MEKHLDPAVYVTAAVTLSEADRKDYYGRYSCVAVSRAEDEMNVHRQAYRDMFIPNDDDEQCGCKGSWWNGRFTKRNQLSRSIALLLMAEMVHDGAV